MSSTKVLWVSDSSVASHTGFGRVSYELLTRLSKIPDFDLAELGSGNPNGTGYKAEPNWKIYFSGKSPVCEDKFLETVLDFSPDVVVSLMDVHMNAYINDYFKVPLAVRNTFKAITHVPIDGAPLPFSYLNTLLGWNKIVPIHPWGENIIRKGMQTQVKRLTNRNSALIATQDPSEIVDEVSLNDLYIQAFIDSQSNIRCIPHGVDLSVYHPAENRDELRAKFGFTDKNFVFIHVGRNSPRKMTATLLEAFKEVNTKHPDTRLILGCAMRDTGWDLNDTLREFEINPEALFITDNSVTVGEGLTDIQIAELYQVSDCFVSPAYGGGFELCHAESMAVGLPQIGVKDAGSIDTMVDGHGILVKAKKWNLGGQFGPFQRPIVEAHDFALAMTKMMQDHKKREYWAKAAFDYATSDYFNWDRIAGEFEAVIRESLLDTSVAVEGVSL